MPSVSPEERARIVALFRHGVPQRGIAEETGRPLSTINRICQAYRDEGRLENLPRGHRQRATGNEEDLHIVAAAAVAPNMTARQIKDTLQLSASTSTIRRRLHEANLRSRVPSQKPLVSAANRQARLLFAQSHASWPVEHWRYVMFSDESTFSTRWDQRQRIWRAENTRYVFPTVLTLSYLMSGSFNDMAKISHIATRKGSFYLFIYSFIYLLI